MSAQKPRRGAYVIDTTRDTLGEVMDHIDGHIQLRPLNGGLEWDASSSELRPATAAEVRAAKRCSGGGK
ncbi:hypothetical protein [Streptomyces orinoci]|uniref:Uncharacterized protein n=1 Tax=Streptomyces orinoci TaxID=67339 RepID=A0ABV3K6F7_STRON|nr:hypothetical protein [Streptomyces orinoci]